MTAAHAAGEQPQRHPLATGVSPGHIRGALLPEDRGAFDAAYTGALDEARETLELPCAASAGVAVPIEPRHAVVGLAG